MRHPNWSLRFASVSAVLTLTLAPAFAGERFNNAFDGRSIDVVNGSDFDRMVWLADNGNFSGQDWTMSSAGGGWLKLKTQFTGRGRCLDVIADGDLEGYLFMGRCQPIPEQAWSTVDVGVTTFTLVNRAWGEDFCVMPDLNGPMASFLRMTECGGGSAETWSSEAF